MKRVDVDTTFTAGSLFMWINIVFRINSLQNRIPYTSKYGEQIFIASNMKMYLSIYLTGVSIEYILE